MNQIKWAFENMKGSRLLFLFGIFLQSLVYVPCLTIGPIFLSRFVDRVFTAEGIYLDRVAIYLVLTYLVLYVVRSLAYYGFALTLNRVGMNVITNLRNTLYERLSGLSPKFFSKTRTDDIMMRRTGDLDSIRHFVAFDIPHTFYAVGCVVAGLIIFYSINWVLATILFCTAPHFCRTAATLP